MKNTSISNLIILFVVTALLAACGPTRPASDNDASRGPQAWFDAPLPNSVFVPPDPINLVMHASDVNGISKIELSANGVVTAEIPSPNTSDSLITLTYEWHPPKSDRYLMTFRAQNNDGAWSPFAETVLVVSEEIISQNNLPTASPTLTETPSTQSSPQAPTNTPEPAAISFESFSTGTVYFRGDGCGPKDVMVRVRAMDPAGINVVVLFYQIASKSGNGATAFNSIAMNPAGGDLYQLTLTPESIYGAGQLSNYGEAWLVLQAVIQNSNGDTKTRTSMNSNTTVAPCGESSPPQATATLSLRTFPTPTNTPVVVR